MLPVFVFALLAAPATEAPAPSPVTVTASYVAAARPGADAHVVVSLVPRDPAVHVNEEPAPRLKLDPAQGVLADRQRPSPARRTGGGDPGTAKYLDAAVPVTFPVAL